MGFSKFPELRAQLCGKQDTYGKGRNTEQTDIFVPAHLSLIFSFLSETDLKTELLVKPSADCQRCPGRHPELTPEASYKSHLLFAGDSWPFEEEKHGDFSA